MGLSPNKLLVAEILQEMPRETGMSVHGWLDREVEGMDRAVLATTRAGHKQILAIRGGHILLLIPHEEGIDTIDCGEIRGLSVTTHRKAVRGEGGLLDIRYSLAHPLIEALNLGIDLAYIDQKTREGLLKDLEPFTKSG